MEDQQPAAGGLTVEDAEESKATEEATVGEETEAADEAKTDDEDEAEAESEADESEAETDSASTESVAKPAKKKEKKKNSRRLAAVAVAVAAALFVGSAGFAGAMVQPYLAERATVDIKYKVARAAASAITTLWSYTPENMDSLADRAGKYLTGDFGAQYRKFVEPIVAPNKQAQITNSTEVTGVAVESLDGPNAVAIVYTNTTTTSPLKKNIPSLQYLSYRLIMKREHGNWLVTRMTTITSLDVTPHL